VLEIISPGGFEVSFREMHTLGDALDPDKTTDIAGRYGVEGDFERTRPIIERHKLVFSVSSLNNDAVQSNAAKHAEFLPTFCPRFCCEQMLKDANKRHSTVEIRYESRSTCSYWSFLGRSWLNSKTVPEQLGCGFDSHLRHHFESKTDETRARSARARDPVLTFCSPFTDYVPMHEPSHACSL